MNRLNCLASSYASSYLLAPSTSSSSLRLFLANLPLTIGMSKQQRQRRQRQRQYLPSINLPSLAHSSLYGKSGAQFFLHLCLYLNPVLRCGHLSEQCGQCVPELVQCGSSSITNTGTQTTPRTPFPLPPPLFILSLPLLTAAELRVWRNAHTCVPFFSSKSFFLSLSHRSRVCAPLAHHLPGHCRLPSSLSLFSFPFPFFFSVHLPLSLPPPLSVLHHQHFHTHTYTHTKWKESESFCCARGVDSIRRQTAVMHGISLQGTISTGASLHIFN